MDLAIERLACVEKLLQITFEAWKTSCGFSSFVVDLVHLRPEVSCNQGYE